MLSILNEVTLQQELKKKSRQIMCFGQQSKIKQQQKKQSEKSLSESGIKPGNPRIPIG